MLILDPIAYVLFAATWWPNLCASVSKFIDVYKTFKRVKDSSSLPAGIICTLLILDSYFIT